MELATYLKINPADSVVVCLQPKKKGEIITVDGKSVILNQDTPAGHKVLIKDVQEGENIIKYGYPIGHAKQALKAGDWVLSFQHPLRRSTRRCSSCGGKAPG